MVGSATRRGAVLFVVATVLGHSTSGVKGASITPDERLSFLCDDRCSDIINKASQIDPTNQLLVLTNQDANPLESLTELSIRAPCINATKALEVINDVPGMTLSLSGVSVDMRKLTEYNQPKVINAFAIDVKLSGGSLFDKPDIFAILGYPQILGVDRAPPGTWVWYTLAPKPYDGKSLFEFSSVELSDPSSPLRITKELVLPRLLKVRAVAADGSPTSTDVLGRSETELFNDSDNSVIPLCSSSIFMGVSGKLPVTCYRDARAEGKSWKYTIYMFAWDLKIVDFNDPNRVEALASNRTKFMDIYVGQEGDKSYFQLLENRYNPNTLRAEGRLSPRPGDPSLPDPAERAYYLKFDIDYPTKDRSSSNQAPTYWTFICIIYGPVNLEYESVTTDVSNGFLDTPRHTLDPDVLWLLTSCWTNLFKFPPHDTSFIPDLRRLIGFLQFDRQTVRDDYALASLVKLDNEVNTRYPLGQIPVTQLSLDIYQGTLLRYAETYQLLKLQTFNALNFNSAQRDRRTAAQVALEQTRNAESTAYAIYTRLRDRATDQRNAINDFYAIYQERNSTMAKNLDKFDEGIEGFIGQQSALLVLAILSAIFQVAAGVVKGEPWGVAQGAINAVKGIVDIVKVIKSVERLKELLDNLQGIWETFNVLFALENDATFIIERIENALEKEDPTLFTAEDRKRLASGAFRYDLSGLQQALLNYTNVQLTASDIMSPAITNKVPGASGYTISLKEFANGGAFLLELEVEYVDTLTQQIVAGVKFINTKVNTRAASKLLADIGADPLTLRVCMNSCCGNVTQWHFTANRR